MEITLTERAAAATAILREQEKLDAHLPVWVAGDGSSGCSGCPSAQ